VGEHLGLTGHDGVVTADLRVAFGLVGLERHKQVIGMLARQLGVGAVDRLVQAFTMAGGAIAFLQQCGHFSGRRTRLAAACGQVLAQGFVVGSNVQDVLLAQAGCNALHRGVLAIALLVSSERRGNVLGVLPSDHGHLVDLGEAGLITRDAVAANAHGNLGLGCIGTADFGVRGLCSH
jgi:hypothetical protein